MQVTLTAPGDFIKITQDKPILYATKLTGWIEDITGSGTYKKEFRWGTSNRVRASWVELTEKNLKAVLLDPNNDLFVDFRITFIAGGPITVNYIEIEYEQDPIAKDPYIGFVPVYTVAEKGNISNITKIENFTFKPYEVNPLVVLYKEVSYTVNQLFGIDVMYARAVPMAIGKDFVLSEWTLYDVDEPKCIKVVVPNNEFPDSKLSFNPMGIDFEMPFEVHITKNYFEDLFGVGTAPQRRDIIYMPLENRIYEVDSSYLYKDLMRTEIYWKVSLVKYHPKANRKEPTSLREEFDVLTTSYQEEFQEELDLVEVEVTKPQQYDPKIGSRDYDPTRLSINDLLNITQSKFRNYSLMLTESQYDLRSVFNNGSPLNAVTYRAKVELPISAERSFSCWFKELAPNVSIQKDNVRGPLTLGDEVNGYRQLSYIAPARRTYLVGDIIKITKPNGFVVYGMWESTTQVQGGQRYTILVKPEVINFLNTYYPNWSSSSGTGYTAEKTFENIIFNGYDIENNKGLRISLYASRYISVKRNDVETIFILKNNVVQDYWYALFMNFSNFYRQMSLNVWVRKWNESNPNPPQTTDLENIYTAVETIEPIDLSVDKNYEILGSNIVLTNIRLYDKIETDELKQMNMLNQAIVKDSQFSIIIDNAIPRLQLPWIANTK